MPHCEKCGGIVPDNAKFCEHCGTPVNNSNTVNIITEPLKEEKLPNYKNTIRKILKFGLMGAGAILVFIIIIALISTVTAPPPNCGNK
jgi:uncharacterized membrane protein YvbJ